MVKSVFIFTFMFFWINAFSEDKIIKVGVYDFAPHVISVDNKLNGAVIDYINDKIHPKLGSYKLEIVVFPFSRIMDDLKTGKLDAVFMVSKTLDRELIYDYQKLELFKTHSALIFNKGRKNEKLESSSQIDNLTIGHTLGSVVVKFIADSKAKIEYLGGDNTLKRNLEMLKMKRLDAVFAPTISHANYIIKASGSTNDFLVNKIPGSELGLYITFRKNLPDEIKKKFTVDNVLIKNYLSYLSKY